MKPRTNWGDFYQGSGGVGYFLDHVAIHKDFLKEILCRQPQTSLEAGCGSAIMSIFLAMTGIKATAVDRDDKVLKKAEATTHEWNASVRFLKEDILKMSFENGSFDAVFSQGVLEHLNDEHIRQASAEALRVGKVFIFSVPGEHYHHRDFGDERLLSCAQWKKILHGIGKLEIIPYYELRTKRNLFLKKPLMLMGTLCC